MEPGKQQFIYLFSVLVMVFYFIILYCNFEKINHVISIRNLTYRTRNKHHRVFHPQSNSLPGKILEDIAREIHFAKTHDDVDKRIVKAG